MKFEDLGFRSSKQQLQDELNVAYLAMTDPEARDKAKRKREREERIKEQVEDYGL